MNQKIYRKSTEAAFRIVENEAVIVTPAEGIIRVLNDAGSVIWQHLHGRHTLSEIYNILSTEFDISSEDAERDVSEFIKDLEERKLIEIIND